MPAVTQVWRTVTLRADGGSLPLFPKGFHKVMGVVKKHLLPPQTPPPKSLSLCPTSAGEGDLSSPEVSEEEGEVRGGADPEGGHGAVNPA